MCRVHTKVVAWTGRCIDKLSIRRVVAGWTKSSNAAAIVCFAGGAAAGAADGAAAAASRALLPLAAKEATLPVQSHQRC